MEPWPDAFVYTVNGDEHVLMDSMRPYRHGNLPAALLAAARQILDENGLQAVGLRETARRVGVSATAAYRHFTNKEDLLASVAAQGFHELAASMQKATHGANPLVRAGLAYIEFADQNRGLFRLMFGPVLAERTKYPALQAASAEVEGLLLRGVTDIDPRPLNDNNAAMAAWGLVHGLAHLIVDGLFPLTRATIQAEEILGKIRLPRPRTSEPAE
jgi:AcrR family transcriptional regulator